jgi:RHS repeat-associated protein
LDYFNARYCSNIQGRFTSPDPFGHWMMDDKQRAEYISNPQRWNRYVYVLNNPLKYVDPSGLAEVPTWDNLSQELRKDLEKRGVTKDLWDKQWKDNNKRQQVLNARAQLKALGVWDNVTSIGFARFESDLVESAGGASSIGKVQQKLTSYSIDNVWGWELAITTNKDIRPALKSQGFYEQTAGHVEAAWQLKQPEQKNTDIVFHVLGVKSPYDRYTDLHFDGGAGGLSLRHAIDVARNTNVSPDEVTRGLGKNPAVAQHLRGISPAIDRLLSQK